MPILTTHKQIQELRHLSFCYICGRTFGDNDGKNRDHVPPKSAFAKSDRNVPIALPTHIACNSKFKLIDEKIGQVIALKHGKAPSPKNWRLSIRTFDSPTGGSPLGVVSNLDIPGAIRRWVRAFHSALYRGPMPDGARFAIQTPFPSAKLSTGKPDFDAIPAQHELFVKTIKLNRAAANLDEIRCNNGKLVYQCVWVPADNGVWICVFALDIYNWKDLGDVNNFAARGCAGSYVLPAGLTPRFATKGTNLIAEAGNADKLDPFSN